jgi:16S rRNA (guanine966-N2)-methyltransferase
LGDGGCGWCALRPGEVRIIGGQWKRSKLSVPDLPGLRPTPDRVRETLFNWLGAELEGWVCVDVFAGTGVLGLECASRGAQRVHLFETQAKLCENMSRMVEKFHASQVQVKKGDGVSALRVMPSQSVDLVLIDPPFELDLWSSALSASVGPLKPLGLIYLESPKPWDNEALLGLGLEIYKTMKAGTVHAHLIVKKSS